MTLPQTHERAAAADRACSVPSIEAVDSAISRLHGYFRDTQYDAGFWWGELESNNTMEAEYVMLCRFLGRHNPERERHIVNYLLSKQQDDGSWPIYFGAPGDLSTSVECYFALKLCGVDPESDPMARAREFILERGGIPQARMFTKIWLSLFGQWKWEGTPRLPTEMILLPNWAPFSIYRFASWARGCIVPLSIVLTRHPIREIPPEHAIYELLPDGKDGTDYSLDNPAWVQPPPVGPPHRKDRRHHLQSDPFQSFPQSRREESGPMDFGASGSRRQLGRHPTPMGLQLDRPQRLRFRKRTPGHGPGIRRPGRIRHPKRR